ncbi:hypothetical protein FACS1894217_05270 [Clostridia bacterium]|nr:hypothetical protein FACS1894217_05270 [Clostridia bacterium]
MGLEVINRLKKEKGLTNKKLSDISGVTLTTLEKITAGVNINPKLKTLQDICRALGCTLDDLDDQPHSKLIPFPQSDLTAEEQEHVRKYRRLGGDDRRYIDGVVDTLIAKHELVREEAAT